MTPLTQPADVEAMMADLALSAESSADAYLASARATLLKILARPDLLDRTRLVAPPEGLGRNLLFGTRRSTTTIAPAVSACSAAACGKRGIARSATPTRSRPWMRSGSPATWPA